MKSIVICQGHIWGASASVSHLESEKKISTMNTFENVLLICGPTPGLLLHF